MTFPPSEAPRVSVLMAVHNGEAYLAEAIESILGQTFTDFEFLIVDDGSSDRSREIVEGYAAKQPRIRFHARENRGLAASLNELMGQARGVYLARMDADDISYPERFALQVAHLDAHPEIVALGGWVRFMDDAGRPVIDTQLPTTHEEIDAQNLVGRTAMMHPTVMIRKIAAEAVGGYDESFPTSQDLDMWLRLGERGRLENLPHLVMDYRFSEKGVSARKRDIQAGTNLRACESAWSRRGLSPQERQYVPWRPGTDRASRRDFALKWAWQARRFGYAATARHYFLKALWIDPFSVLSWKGLLFGALLGRGKGGASA